MKLKRTNKLLALLLTLVMVVGMLPTFALPALAASYTLSIESENGTFTGNNLLLSSNLDSFSIIYNSNDEDKEVIKGNLTIM